MIVAVDFASAGTTASAVTSRPPASSARRAGEIARLESISIALSVSTKPRCETFHWRMPDATLPPFPGTAGRARLGRARLSRGDRRPSRRRGRLPGDVHRGAARLPQARARATCAHGCSRSRTMAIDHHRARGRRAAPAGSAEEVAGGEPGTNFPGRRQWREGGPSCGRPSAACRRSSGAPWFSASPRTCRMPESPRRWTARRLPPAAASEGLALREVFA